MIHVGAATWREVAAAAPGAVALVPVGAIEAHGPHLPLETDVIIAREWAERGARALEDRGERVLILPPVVFTAAAFARAFPGTVHVSPGALERMLCDVVASVRAWGVREVALVSAHLDPAHLRAVRAAAAKSGARLADLLERENARRLSEEFRQGGPHAGRFETSLVLAARPDAVREDIRQALPSVDVNLGRAIKEGARTFEEAGGSQAYFGDPASASAREGDALFGVLVEILLDALRSGS